jgi:purine-binding chemotaxis protein CheW
LAKQLKRPVDSYTIDDHLIVLQSQEERLAIVVQQVLGVRQISREDIEPVSGTPVGENRLVTELGKSDDRIVMLLDAEQLIRLATERDVSEITAETEPQLDGASWSAAASPGDREEFRERAQRLLQPLRTERVGEMIALAVTEIAGEYFAFPFDYVREFFEPHQITPVPCCPPRILGNVNLRGEILTLVDIRAALNLPENPSGTGGKVVVVNVPPLVAGAVVDVLHDVIYLHSTELTVSAQSHSSGEDNHALAVVPYRGRMMSVLDLPRLFQLQRWVVDEEVDNG